MGIVFRKRYARSLPRNAELVNEDGKWYAQWRDRNGNELRGRVKIGRGGRERVIVAGDVYWARYRDVYGQTVTRSTNATDRAAALDRLEEFESQVEHELRPTLSTETPPDRPKESGPTVRGLLESVVQPPTDDGVIDAEFTPIDNQDVDDAEETSPNRQSNETARPAIPPQLRCNGRSESLPS